MTYKLGITDTTLRDAHQSLWATRMRTVDMLPVIEKIDSVGYHSLEVWGGATFDVCLRYLHEDPWDRLRLLKSRVKKTPLQMLLRGQSLVGYQHYPDDVVEAFVHKSVENGINIIRIFDALNDVRNLEASMRAAKKAGAHVQAAVVYTISPVHTTGHYIKTAVELAQLGADSICIKDMAGLLAPYVAYELVKLLKEKVGLPVQLHSHYIGGMAVGAYIKAAEAGVDVVDTASVPISFGASQPPVETVVRVFRDSPYDTGLDIQLLFDIASYFENLRKSLGYRRGVTRITDMQVFEHQVPGGMISNLVSQLEEQKALHRLPEVLAEIPKVRAELGYPPLVTPTSQIVGTQAVFNVLSGERYRMVPGEVKAYVRGLYGRPPAPVEENVSKIILGGQSAVTCRPADLLEPQMGKVREEVKGIAVSEEDILSYAIFPQVARRFLTSRLQPDTGAAGNEGDQSVSKNAVEEIEFESVITDVNLRDVRELIELVNRTDISEVVLQNTSGKVVIKKSGKAPLPDVPGEVQAVTVQNKSFAQGPVGDKNAGQDGDTFTVIAPLVGTFYRKSSPEAPPYVEVGDMVKKGQVLCIIEAMKMMNEIKSEVDGEVAAILAEDTKAVQYGEDLFLIMKKKT